jgi:signal transduction histidine kinase
MVGTGGAAYMSSARRQDGQDGSGTPALSSMLVAELLAEVQEQLHSVTHAQARVQRLLDAVLSVASGLDLASTLRRIVEAGIDLVDARYGALGVLAAGGGLAAFVHVGIDDDLAREMGALPEGKGVLGQLIREPFPLRIPDLGAHPSSVGFPPKHPEMKSFLGVPVLVRGEVYGNLYMTEKHTGTFTAEDESTLAALAAAAGVAIDNARLYEESMLRERWLAAVADLRAVLLDAASEAEAQALIAERMTDLTAADATWLLAGPDPDDHCYSVLAQDGNGLVDLTGERLHAASSPVLAGVEAAEGGVVTLDLSGIVYESRNPHIDWGPCLGIALRGRHTPDTVVIATRTAGAPPFDPSIVPLVTAFADQASVSLDMAARQRLARELDVYEDRDRIARDLHDHVIQRVFAAGLALQAVLPRVADPQARSRVEYVVGQLDDTVRDIRTTIFDLHSPAATTQGGSLRRRLLDMVTETAAGVLAPTVRMSGAVDSLVTGELAADVEAVVREGVSNAVRHSGGEHVTVTLDVTDDVVVEVVDDGNGIDRRAARSGLRNLTERARRRGGNAELERLSDGGTRLRWWAPLD